MPNLWVDDSSTQNKGSKPFRNLSDLSAVDQTTIVTNFPVTAHFPGPWDTEGGRETRAIKRFILNDGDSVDGESVLDAGDNVKLLRKIMGKAGQPAPPVQSQKMWRPDQSQTITPSTTEVPPVTGPAPKRQRRGRTDAQMQDDDTDPHYVITRRHI